MANGNPLQFKFQSSRFRVLKAKVEFTRSRKIIKKKSTSMNGQTTDAIQTKKISEFLFDQKKQAILMNKLIKSLFAFEGYKFEKKTKFDFC